MIVRRAPDGLHLITQPDHAHLARRIMEHAVPLTARPRRDSILLAIGEHDNGWAEADASPTRDRETGHVADFVGVPVSVRQGAWPRGVARLRHDPWAAALVAHHAITVYDRYRSDPAWTLFFAEMETARTTMLRASGLPLCELQADYPFVRLGDLISLAFCTGWTDVHGFAEWTVHLTVARVVVAPDVFGGLTVPIEVTARIIRARTFQSDAELGDAVRKAPTTTLRGTVTSRAL